MPQKPKDNTKADGKDLFQTPHYATKLLLPYLKPFTMVWECASGYRHMAEILEHDHAVWCSDVRWHDEAGYVTTNEKWDFLEQTKDDAWMKQIDYIITNPPFSKKKRFFNKCWYYWEHYQIPFALLIPADYAQWNIDAVRNKDCIKLIPTQRIDFITPTGLSGAPDAHGKKHTSRFHSLWLTKGIYRDTSEHATGDDYPTEVYVELTNEMKKDI